MVTTPTLWGSRTTIVADPTAFNMSIAPLQEGGFAVVFEQAASAGGRDLGGRLFTELGVATGGNFMASTSATNPALGSPQAVQLLNGSLAVLFTYEFSPTDHDIYSTVLSGPGFATGTPLIAVNTAVADDIPVYELEPTADGNLVGLWQRNGAGDGNDPVLLQRIGSGGGAAGNAISVDATTAESQGAADIAVLRNGNLAVVWSSFNFATFTSALLLRVFDQAGTGISVEIPFATAPNPAFPTVEALANGNFVVVWQDVTEGRIYSQIYNSVGGVVSARQFADAAFAILPKVTALADGGYLVGWSSFGGIEGDGSPDGSLAFQRYGAGGNAIGQALNIDNPGDQNLLELQTLTDGRVVAGYSNETGDSTNVTNLVFQVLDPREATIVGTNAAESIVGREDASTLRGQGGADRLTGRNNNDRAFGDAGNDTLIGGRGNDLLQGGSGNDSQRGDAGNDDLRGGSGNDVLIGNDGNDTLNGGIGNDELSGDAGRDLLTGGGGLDRFDYDSVSDSGVAPGNQDLIFDFVRGLDVIDLATIDARQDLASNQAFAFIGAAAFSAAGQLRATAAAGQTVIEANVLGADGAEMVIRLQGALALSAADFLL